MNRKMVAEYANLFRRKGELDAELANVKQRIGELETPIMDDLTQEGLQSVKTEDGATVYLRRQVWAGIADGYNRDQLCAGLVAAGLAEFVAPSCNMQSLSAYFRERLREEECETDELKVPAGVKLTERMSVQVRTS